MYVFTCFRTRLPLIDLLQWLTFVGFPLLLRYCSIGISLPLNLQVLLPSCITTIPSRPEISPSSALLKPSLDRLMIVPLIQPAVTSANANLVIKMNVGLETTTFGAVGRDLAFVISDGSRFIGMLDTAVFSGITTCLGIEGTSGPNYESPPFRCSSPQTI